MKKFVLFGGMLLLIAGLAWGVVKRQAASPEQVPAPGAMALRVDTIRLTHRTLQETVDMYGSLAPKVSTQVRAEIHGTVRSVRVKEWDRVKPADLLLQLDPTDVHLAVQQGEAALQMARAQESQARVDLDRAQREWDRAVRLKQGGLITAQECDERQSALDAARARRDLAAAQISQTAARLAEIKRSLQKTAVLSPIAGTVSQRHVDIGIFVDKGAPLFTIVDNRVLDLTATVSAIDLVSVREGQPIQFTVDGFGDRLFEGTIKRINPVVDAADRSGKIVAEVPNPKEELRGGLFVRGRILVKRLDQVPVLPKNSLAQWDIQQKRATVLIVNASDTVETRTISTGMSDEAWVEVRAGIDPSDRVVLRGGFTVKPGDRVQVSDSAPKTASGKENG